MFIRLKGITIVAMSNRRILLPVVLLVLFFACGLFLLFQTNVGKVISGGLEVALSPFQQKTQQVVVNAGNVGGDEKVMALTSENRKLSAELSQMQDLKRENKALQDQFQTQSIPTHTLLPAMVIGSRSFVPGVSAPTSLVINKGQDDGVMKGEAVVYQNNLVGQVTTVFTHAARVTLVTNTDSSLTVRTSGTKALGIARGQSGDGVLLDNVTLTDTLKNGDMVESKGDTDDHGVGVPPGLVIGKILAVHKRSSSLFQTADVESLLDFSRLETVFIIVQKS